MQSRPLMHFAIPRDHVVDEAPPSQPVAERVTQSNVHAIVCAVVFVITTLLFTLH